MKEGAKTTHSMQQAVFIVEKNHKILEEVDVPVED